MPLFQPCLTNPLGLKEIQQLVLQVIQTSVGLEDLPLDELSLSLYC